MRLAVLSKDMLRVFDGREEVARYTVNSDPTEIEVEMARVALYPAATKNGPA